MPTDAPADEFYGGDPATFVGRLDALTRELRAGGRQDQATAVKAGLEAVGPQSSVVVDAMRSTLLAEAAARLVLDTA